MLADPSAMVGRWDPWYQSGERLAHCYGPSHTYEIARDWLEGLAVEDWGCGYARFRDLHRGGYLGVDGSGPWADVIGDLRAKPTRAPRPGLLLRHVLEHNPDWEAILGHAIAHFTRRMVLVAFTPDSATLAARPVGRVAELGVVDLALPHRVIDAAFAGCRVLDRSHVATATGYSGETVWRAER